MFWTLWCERIENLMTAKGAGSSLSETTAASSSSTSTLYLLSSEVEVAKKSNNRGNRSVCRVWAHYGGAGDSLSPSWPQKDLFLGKSHAQMGYGYYAPVPVRFAGASLDDLKQELLDHSRQAKRGCYSWPGGPNCPNGRNQQSGGLCDVLFTRDKSLCDPCGVNFAEGIRADGLWTTEFTEESGEPRQEEKYKSKSGGQSTAQRIINLAPKISRFGFGIRENCRSGLYLDPSGPKKTFCVSQVAHSFLDPYKLVESGVNVWEENVLRRKKRDRHQRRYGLVTAAHFLHALGPWSVQPGEQESVQGRRSLSAVGVRRQPADPELRLPVSRRQLAGSISATALEPGRNGAIGAATRGRVVLFWTPEYWYRPRAATAAYRELRQHLAQLQKFRTEKEERRCAERNFFGRYKRGIGGQSDGGDFAEETAGRILRRIFSSNGRTSTQKRKKNRDDVPEGGSTTSQLRRLLKMDFRVSLWDLDSTTIATQLTLVDRDLFLRIPPLEVEIVVFQRSSRNAPNLAAWIAFSHRVSCLMASEVLVVKRLESRARLVARLINAATKCHASGNFHSARSILAGLQSPPIFRLRATWAHLRVHHASKYEAIERLAKIYKSPRTRRYRRTWAKAETNPPAMPYVGDLLLRLLGLNSELKETSKPKTNTEFSRKSNQSCNTIETRSEGVCKSDHIGLTRRIFSAAFFRHKNTAKTSSCIPESNEELWNSRQRFLARMAYERWRDYISELRIIVENDAKLRNMDERKKRVLEVASWLTECQKSTQNYSFPGHSMAWEFLLKARYKEDRENFFISLKLEPPSA